MPIFVTRYGTNHPERVVTPADVAAHGSVAADSDSESAQDDGGTIVQVMQSRASTATQTAGTVIIEAEYPDDTFPALDSAYQTPMIDSSQLSPTAGVSVLANTSTIINRKFTIRSGLKAQVLSGGMLRIL